jgi:uncharacterized SAM-binding protein YcdF (DUF218 family)
MVIKKLHIISIIVVLLLVIIFTHKLWLEAIAEFLAVNDKLTQTDAIVVLDSGNGPAYNHGVELYKLGYGKKIILVGGNINLPGIRTTSAHLTMQWVINSMKVPQDDVMVEERPMSIYESAEYIKEDMIRWNFKSAVIVGLPYHTRRAKMTFKRIFDNKDDISLIFSSADDEQFRSHKWWTRENESIAVITEYCKIILYFFKYIL